MSRGRFLFLFLIIGFQGLSQTDSTRTVTVRDIHILGNDKTRERIILREMYPRPGDSFRLTELADTLEFDRQRIYNTNLFNVVEISIQEIQNDQVDLLVRLEERWYMYPVPLFKLADRNFNDWWVNRNRNFQRVNYGLRYTQYNFRGRAERLRLTLQTGFEDRYLLEYRIPYIDKKQRHGIEPEVFFLMNKNLGFETQDHLRTFLMSEEQLRRSTGVSMTHTYRKRFYDYHFTIAGYYQINIADTIAALNPNYLGDGKTNLQYAALTYGYQNDRRDNINYPMSGHNFIFGISKSGLGGGDVDFWSMSTKAAKWWSLGRNFSHGSSVFGYWSSDPDRAFVNYWGLGFEQQQNVRGYELDLIEGRAYLMTKNSTRKLIWKREADISKVMPLKQFQRFPIAFYGKLFFDGAYVWGFDGNENNARLTNKVIYSVGTGVDVVTSHDLVIRFEYSANSGGENQFFINFLSEF